MPVLETARLWLTPVSLADASRTQEIFPHWEIVRYLAASVPWPFPSDGAEKYYREVALPGMARGSEWDWVLRLKASPKEHIGAISLSTAGEDNRGFWLGLPWHGQGLMTEAVVATNDFWFNELHQPVLRVPKASANATSRRISEKTGMRLVGTFEKDFVSGRLPSEIWEITAAEWQSHRQGLSSGDGPPKRNKKGEPSRRIRLLLTRIDLRLVMAIVPVVDPHGPRHHAHRGKHCRGIRGSCPPAGDSARHARGTGHGSHNADRYR